MSTDFAGLSPGDLGEVDPSAVDETFRWGTPPRAKRGPAQSERWAATARALRAKPLEWAAVYEAPFAEDGKAPSTPRLSHIAAFRPVNDFRWTVRTEERFDGRKWRVLYARYVGAD